VARIRLDSWKSMRPFKGIFYNDISEFESDHLSHAVVSAEPLECAENSMEGIPGEQTLTAKTVRLRHFTRLS
jgi:hypothetical protein